jgi:hypothetical protein
MLRLFHVSDNSGLTLFEPRRAPSPDAGVTGDAVWAIDEEHLPNYLWPRDCPRVTYAATDRTSPEDIAKFFDNTTARRVIVLEQAWLDRIGREPVYVYEMPTASFNLIDSSAGYYISRETVVPLGERELHDPLAEVTDRGCEIRLVPDLWPIRNAVANSTLDYSIIRMRNARSAP